MSLRQLQRDLQRHVLHGHRNIETEIVDAAGVARDVRLAVYSDAYRLRLIEALEANYPVLAQLLGADQFTLLSRRYLDSYPSQHFSIRWFGHRLAEFAAVAYGDSPWLVELARWEWATAHAFDAADATPMTADDLAGTTADQWPTLKFRPQPSLQRLQLTTNIVAIVKASVAEQALPVPEQSHATEWCLWRHDLAVRYRSLDSIEAAAIDAVINGATFGELCERLAAQLPTDDVPLRAASYLKQWLDEQWLCKQ